MRQVWCLKVLILMASMLTSLLLHPPAQSPGDAHDPSIQGVQYYYGERIQGLGPWRVSPGAHASLLQAIPCDLTLDCRLCACKQAWQG